MNVRNSFGVFAFRALLRFLPFLRHRPAGVYLYPSDRPHIRPCLPLWFCRWYCERLEGEIQIIDGVHSWKPGAL